MFGVINSLILLITYCMSGMLNGKKKTDNLANPSVMLTILNELTYQNGDGPHMIKLISC